MIKNYLDFHRTVGAGNFKRLKEFYDNGGTAVLNKNLTYACGATWIIPLPLVVAFQRGYYDIARLLIEKVRAVNGEDVKILWVGGMMSNPSNPNNVRADAWIRELFAELGGEANNLYLKMDLIRDTSGAAGHPVEGTHKTNARLIANFIIGNILKEN